MRLLVLLTGSSVLAWSGCAYASASSAAPNPLIQDAPAPSAQVGTSAPSPQNADAAASGDIIVTAQRRAQSLQDVPIAITVVTGSSLQTTAANSVNDIQNFTPSLSISTGGGLSSFKVRGVGSQNFDYGVEPSVGVVLDDVVQTLPRAPVLNTLADVDRIEILRGPQGTLFGKNTSAGLVSITTKKPQLGLRAYEGHVQYGSRNELQTYQIVNLPVTDTLAIRLRAGYQMRDPVVSNRGSGTIENTRDVTLNGKLYWEPTDRLSLYAIGDYQNSRGDGSGVASIRSLGIGTVAPAAGNTFIAVGQAAAGIVPGADSRSVNFSGNVYQHSETKGGQLTITYDLGPVQLTSVSAYRKLDYVNDGDVDQSPQVLFDTNVGTISARQITQELRFSNSTTGLVDYVAGLFYYDQKLRSTQDQRGTLGYIPQGSPFELSVLGGLSNIANRTKSYAVFGDATIKPVTGLRLIVGGRYTRDSLDAYNNVLPIANTCSLTILFGGPCTPVPLPSPVLGDRLKQGNWSGRAGLQFDVTRDVMFYGTASRGYKAPAVTVVSGLVFNVNKETVFALEAGVKAELFERRLTANIAVFRSKFTDFQTEVFDPSVGLGAFRTGNAGGLRAQGVEAELTARPFQGFNLSGGLTYNDAKFTDYQPPCYAGQSAAQGCNLPGPTFDAEGLRLQNAPRWTYQITGTYETEVADSFKMYGTANWSHRSSVLFGVGDPATFQSGYGVLNVSAGVGDLNDKVRISVFARNALNKRFTSLIYRTIFDVGGTSQVIPDQAVRRIGAALDWRF